MLLSEFDLIIIVRNNAENSINPIGEEAFVRIAPTIAGVADIPTAHHLFKALVADEEGISYSLWTIYLSELLKVRQARQSYANKDNVLPNEQLLCIGSSKRRPVLKWEDNIAWPGNLTLIDRALCFFDGPFSWYLQLQEQIIFCSMASNALSHSQEVRSQWITACLSQSLIEHLYVHLLNQFDLQEASTFWFFGTESNHIAEGSETEGDDI